MMVEYKVTDRISQPVIDKLLELSKKNNLTAREIVEEARKKNSPLHDFFEWDDSIAAEKYRLAQARFPFPQGIYIHRSPVSAMG